MAEAPPDGIKEEVTCPVCLELFDCPLFLPCTHTFCKACLETMLAKPVLGQGTSGTGPSLRCPQCQETVALPEGVGQLRKNILAANIVATLTKSRADRPYEANEEKSTSKDTRRPPDRSKQKYLQSQLKKLQNLLEQQQCDIADQQEKVQRNLKRVADEEAQKRRQVSEYFRMLAAQLQARDRELQEEVSTSQVKATAVVQGHLTSLEAKMASSLSTMEKVFDLIKRNMSSAEASLQDEVDALTQKTQEVCGTVLEVAGEEMETPAHLQLSGPSLDSFCKEITLHSTFKEKGQTHAVDPASGDSQSTPWGLPALPNGYSQYAAMVQSRKAGGESQSTPRGQPAMTGGQSQSTPRGQPVMTGGQSQSTPRGQPVMTGGQSQSTPRGQPVMTGGQSHSTPQGQPVMTGGQSQSTSRGQPEISGSQYAAMVQSRKAGGEIQSTSRSQAVMTGKKRHCTSGGHPEMASGKRHCTSGGHPEMASGKRHCTSGDNQR